jgi:hypothetical protein
MIANLQSSSSSTTGGNLAFYTTSSALSEDQVFERMRIDSAGNVLVGVTSANANGGILQLSKGITFPATQVAATDANTLDDYEEGTFTPTIVGTTTAGTGTYTAQVGRYTKIGNRVYFSATIGWSAHTGTGNIRVASLPFTSANVTNGYASLGVYANGLVIGAGKQLSSLNVINSTQAELLAVDVAGSAATAIAMDTVVGALNISGHYEV